MKYAVTVEIVSRRKKELTIYARDEQSAEMKAADLVLEWDGVDDVEVLDVVEDE